MERIHVRPESDAKEKPPSTRTEEIPLKAPPLTPRNPPANAFQRLGPILLLFAVGGLLYVGIKSRSAFSGFGMLLPLLLISGTMMMFLNRGGQKKGEVQKERADYLRYLDGCREAAIEAARNQFAAAQFHYPPPRELAQRIGSARMWERRPTAAAFGRARIGVGVERANRSYTPLVVGALEDQEPASVQAVNDFLAEHSFVRDIPRSVNLAEKPAWSFVGDRTAAEAALRSLLMHVAFFYGPDDLGIVVITDDTHGAAWDWVKWLPQQRGPRGRGPLMTFRTTGDFVAAMGKDFHNRGYFTGRGVRSTGLASAAGDSTPGRGAEEARRLLVLCAADVVDWSEMVTDGRAREGVTILDLSGQCPLSTPETTFVFTATEVQRSDTARGRPEFLAVPDAVSVEAAEGFARALSPWAPGTKASRVLAAAGTTTASIDLMELLGIDDAASFDVEAMWQWAQDRRNLLRVPVGRYIDSGRIWYLDFKEYEDAHGPHIGLGGATGSGKSELLRALVTALCITHSPDDLVLTPADFKGNKTFAGLERLPHTLVVLHNLNGSRDRIARVLQVFQGELIHRQELLDSLGDKAKDIKEYRAYRLRHPELGLEPMPYWIIPFDELMQAKRDFPELLIIMGIVGTVGRSLGVSMMPVSQTLDASLMKGISSHVRGRIGLKMNDAAEYRPILGSSNPGGLPNRKGVGYFVEDSEASTPALRIESCYVSGPYVPPTPPETVETVRADRDYFKPVVLSALGDPAAALIERNYSVDDRPPAVDVAEDDDVDDPDSEDDADDGGEDGAVVRGGAPSVMSTVFDVLQRHGRAPRQIWLPELVTYCPVSLHVDDYVLEHGRPGPTDLAAPCGLVDRPREHLQSVLTINLRQNAVFVGKPLSGKSTALMSVILGASMMYSPERVQFYCLDAGGGYLGAVKDLAHVGDVVAGTGNVYGIERVLNHVQHLLRMRSGSWPAAEIYDPDTWRRRRFGGEAGEVPDDGYGDVYLVVDGADTLCHAFPHHKDTLLALAEQAPSYGIHVVLSARSWNGAGMHKFWEVITNWTEMKLTDVTDSTMGRACADAVPEFPGRALISASGAGGARKDSIAAVYSSTDSIPPDPAWHVLFGSPMVETGGGELLDTAASCRHINALHAGQAPARRIPVLGNHVGLGSLAARPGWVRLGLRESDHVPQYWRPTEDSHLVVLGESKCGKSTTLRTIGVQLQELADAAPEGRKPIIVVFDLRQDLLGAIPAADRYVYSMDQVEEAVGYVASLVATRTAGGTLSQSELVARRAKGATFEGPEIFVLIDGYTDFVAGYSDPFDSLQQAAERGSQVGLHVVISRVADQSYVGARGLLGAMRTASAPVVLMSADPSLINLVGQVRGQKLPAGRGLFVGREDRMMIQAAETGQ